MRFRNRLGTVAVAAGLMMAAGTGPGFAQNSDENRVSRLEAEIASLEHRVRLLEDMEAIKRLQQAYGYYRTENMAGEIADLFADRPDVSVEIGGQGAYIGKDRVLDFFAHKAAEMKDGEINNHYIVQGVVHVAPDGKTAKARWRAIMQKGIYGQDGIWAEGPYENEYVKEDGVWKFKKIRRYTNVIASYDEGWTEKPLPLPGPDAEVPPDKAPSQTVSYPSMQFIPYHYNHPVTGKPVRAD